jgi:hypothetical protein
LELRFLDSTDIIKHRNEKFKVGAGKELLKKQKLMIAFAKFQHFSSDLVGMLQKTIPCIPVERKHLLPTKPWTRIQ